MSRVGFIGVGTMGFPMACTIISKGNDLKVYAPYVHKENKTIWNSFYKPEHIKKAAQCSKCTLYYWDIERKLSVQNIISSDIFYQTFDTKGGGGKMICRLCDPKAFTKNKQ